MAFTPYSRFIWSAMQVVRMLGTHFITGMVFALTAYLVYFAEIRPLRLETSSSAKVLNRSEFGSTPVVATTDDPSTKLAKFYAFFPPQDAGPDLITKLYAAAAKQNLVLEQGSYHLRPAENADLLTRYEIILPIKGTYIPIRRFIAQALIDVPNLALDRIIVSRKNANDATLEAELSFTLYLGKQ